MSSVTPFFSIAASSSFLVSSKVNPYWKPEQPPPVTNTRSLSSGLPASSISCLTLLAALSVKSSGAGISVTAFICLGLLTYLAGRELELHALDFGRMMHQAPFDHGALVDLDALVVHVPFDLGPCLEFERLGRVDRAVDGAIDHDMRGLHLAVDARVGR